MTESVFETRKLSDVYDEIREVYLSDNRPWILGFSGGKDSTCMVQLVWNALLALPENHVRKKSTLFLQILWLNLQKLWSKLAGTLDSMEKAAKEQNLPISTNLVRPLTKDSFWVCLLGLGYPAPSNSFRWCTDRLKIRNADRFITEKVSEYGEAIVVLGTRKDESTNRKQSMLTYEIENSYLV